MESISRFHQVFFSVLVIVSVGMAVQSQQGMLDVTQIAVDSQGGVAQTSRRRIARRRPVVTPASQQHATTEKPTVQPTEQPTEYPWSSSQTSRRSIARRRPAVTPASQQHATTEQPTVQPTQQPTDHPSSSPQSSADERCTGTIESHKAAQMSDALTCTRTFGEALHPLCEICKTTLRGSRYTDCLALSESADCPLQLSSGTRRRSPDGNFNNPCLHPGLSMSTTFDSDHKPREKAEVDYGPWFGGTLGRGKNQKASCKCLDKFLKQVLKQSGNTEENLYEGVAQCGGVCPDFQNEVSSCTGGSLAQKSAGNQTDVAGTLLQENSALHSTVALLRRETRMNAMTAQSSDLDSAVEGKCAA